MSREYPERPIIGVAAAVIEDDRVILIRRGQPPAYGEWSLPGGAVEPGETLEEAVIREVGEEVGLKVEVVELVAILDRIILDEAGQVQYHYILVNFLCRRIGGMLQTGGDVLSCTRVPFSALLRYGISKKTREVVERAYQRLHGGSPPIYQVGTTIQA